MEILTIVDKILEIRFVRWGLLLLCTGLLVIGGVQTGRLWLQGIELKGLKSQAEVNEKLQKALRAAGERQKAKAEAAFKEAAAMKARTERMGRDARKYVRRTDCCGALDDALLALEALP